MAIHNEYPVVFVRVPPKLHEAMTLLAKARGMKFTQYVRLALEQSVTADIETLERGTPDGPIDRFLANNAPTEPTGDT